MEEFTTIINDFLWNWYKLALVLMLVFRAYSMVTALSVKVFSSSVKYKAVQSRALLDLGTYFTVKQSDK